MLLTGPSSVISLFAEIYMLYLFSVLSRKLGSVTKMKPHYRGFHWAIGLIVVAIFAHSLRLTAVVTPDFVPEVFRHDEFYLLTYFLPMLLAATLSLIMAVRYWGWLFRERDR